MSSKDWAEPREPYEHTFSGLRTGSELLADLEYEQDLDRGYDREDGPVFVGVRCLNCGAYVLTNPCRLCGEERKAA